MTNSDKPAPHVWVATDFRGRYLYFGPMPNPAAVEYIPASDLAEVLDVLRRVDGMLPRLLKKHYGTAANAWSVDCRAILAKHQKL